MAEDVERVKEELLKRFELTKEQLQERCSDDHLTAISKFVSWDAVGPYLVSKQDIKDIRKDGRDEQDRRRLLIEKWEEKGSEATYDAMITAMLKAGKRKEAEDVFKLLTPERKPICDVVWLLSFTLILVLPLSLSSVDVAVNSS